MKTETWPKGFVCGASQGSTRLNYLITTPASWVVPLHEYTSLILGYIGCILVPLSLGPKFRRDNPPVVSIYVSIYLSISINLSLSWLITPLTITTYQPMVHYSMTRYHAAKAAASASLKRRRISLSHFFPERTEMRSVQNPWMTFHYTDWFIEIRKLAFYNPHKIG